MALCSTRKVISLCFINYQKRFVLSSHQCVKLNYACCTNYSACRNLFYRNYSLFTGDSKDSDKSIEEKKKKKTVPIPKVTLYDTEGNITVITLEEAQSIARRRDLNLVKTSDFDTKSGRATYKLMTKSQFLSDDRTKKGKKESTGFKGVKVVNLASKIGENDLKTKTNNMIKWVAKNYEVRVVVTGDGSDMSGAEKIYTYITSQLKNKERPVQKRVKGGLLKFQILPPKKEDQKSEGKEQITDDEKILSDNDDDDDDERETQTTR